MYNFEIDNTMKKFNCNIPNEEYIKICDSPQIIRISYSAYGDYYEIHTSDDAYWKFKVYLNS